MAWRRTVGACVMLIGAGTLLATVAGTIVLSVSYARSGELAAPAELIASVVICALIGGVATMIGGRAIYGQWTKAAPIANFTAAVTRMVGLTVALILGAMLVFLVLAGIKPEDVVAAIILGVGAVAGIGLVRVGGSLRNRGRRYLDP